ncbi:hypothetical protein JHK82_042866 [Glycine max]|nr:hypothetical protein JHK82_042866 [Glycine max]
MLCGMVSALLCFLLIAAELWGVFEAYAVQDIKEFISWRLKVFSHPFRNIRNPIFERERETTTPRQIDEANEIIEIVPLESDARVYGPLLSASLCQHH